MSEQGKLEDRRGVAVTVLGLGAMGSALARALLAAGHRVTVWNRTASRADALVERGAHMASSPAQAIAASPLCIVCVTDYAATNSVLSSAGVMDTLKDRIVIQLSTGTPEQATALAQLVVGSGGSYLDGAIHSYPKGIGGSDVLIYYSGDQVAFGQAEPVLEAFGGSPVYVSADANAANVYDIALLTLYYGCVVGLCEGAALAVGGGMGLPLFLQLTENTLPVLSSAIQDKIDQLKSSNFKGIDSTLDIESGALASIVDTAKSLSVDGRVPRLMRDLVDEARAAGHGLDDITRLVTVLGPGR